MNRTLQIANVKRASDKNPTHTYLGVSPTECSETLFLGKVSWACLASVVCEMCERVSNPPSATTAMKVTG